MILKYALSSLAFLLIAGNMNAQKPIFTQSKVNEVKVYRNAAELSNTVSFSIPAGNSEIVIGNISDNINEKTLQFGLNNKGVAILSSQFTLNYVSDFPIDETNPAIKKVRDSITIVSDKLVKNKIELEANIKAIELLDKNQTILVGNTTSTVSQLIALTDYYTTKRISLSNTVEAIKKEGESLNKQLNLLKNNLRTNEEKNADQLARGKLVLRLMSNGPATIKMNLNYMVTQASWTPHYEIKGADITAPLEVVFKAMVRQSSGLDWKGVKLTLINGIAAKNNTAPDVQPWFLYPQPINQNNNRNYSIRGMGSVKQEAASNMMDEKASGVQTEDLDVQFSVNSNQLNVSYDVNVPYDILSNNKDHLLSLYSQDIPATYTYFTAPNYLPEAYLLATIEDFSKYGLVSAPATIVFENMYIGETFINPNQTTDELDITLGNDKRISIKRENIKEKSGEKFLSSYKEKTITYDLEIKNNKKGAITINVKDRIPLSTNENIKVEILDDSKAERDLEKGILTWKLNLAASETKKIRVSYKVRYPKDVVLGL